MIACAQVSFCTIPGLKDSKIEVHILMYTFYYVGVMFRNFVKTAI